MNKSNTKTFWKGAILFLVGVAIASAPIFIVKEFFQTNTPEWMMWAMIVSVVPPVLAYKLILKQLYAENRLPLFFIIVNLSIALLSFPNG